MELADVTDSKSVGLITRVGSSPTAGMQPAPIGAVFYVPSKKKYSFLSS